MKDNQTPEAIATALWEERDQYPNLAGEEFLSFDNLLTHVKYEVRAMSAFCELHDARTWFKSLNDSQNK